MTISLSLSLSLYMCGVTSVIFICYMVNDECGSVCVVECTFLGGFNNKVDVRLCDCV